MQGMGQAGQHIPAPIPKNDAQRVEFLRSLNVGPPLLPATLSSCCTALEWEWGIFLLEGGSLGWHRYSFATI